MKHLESKLILFCFAASLVIGGGIAVYLGAKNISQVVQLVYSPLDRPTAAEMGENGSFLTPQEAIDFLPVISLPNSGQGEDLAPEIHSKRNPMRKSPSGEYPDAPVPNLAPERMVIQKIGVDAIVVPVDMSQVEYLGKDYLQWKAPYSGALGWHKTSALLGSAGNTVINGHSSGAADTFKDLAELENGDVIDIYAGDYKYSYAVANVMILKERWEPIEVRLQNALWINPSQDERLTLISCWPNNSSTHRLIVVAIPLDYQRMGQELAQEF